MVSFVHSQIFNKHLLCARYHPGARDLSVDIPKTLTSYSFHSGGKEWQKARKEHNVMQCKVLERKLKQVKEHHFFATEGTSAEKVNHLNRDLGERKKQTLE